MSGYFVWKNVLLKLGGVQKPNTITQRNMKKTIKIIITVPGIVPQWIEEFVVLRLVGSGESLIGIWTEDIHECNLLCDTGFFGVETADMKPVSPLVTFKYYFSGLARMVGQVVLSECGKKWLIVEPWQDPIPETLPEGIEGIFSLDTLSGEEVEALLR